MQIKTPAWANDVWGERIAFINFDGERPPLKQENMKAQKKKKKKSC